MIKAGKIHKERAIQILSACFDANKTVNYIVKQDAKRKERIRALMDYSFDMCLNAEQIYLTDDLNGVIIASHSDDKLPILEEAFLTVKFVLQVTGIEGIRRALKREHYIKSQHPEDEEFLYIWFMAVDKNAQGKGIGSSMVNEIIRMSNEEQISIYLETSSQANLKFYKKLGFEVYHVSDESLFGYELFFLKRLPDTAKIDRYNS